MAIRGPRPKSPTVKALQGRDHNKKKPPLVLDAAPEAAFPEELKHNLPPAVLERAEASFRLLIERHVLSPCDIEPFARYVHHLRLVYEADALIRRNGMIVIDAAGKIQKNPMIQVHKDASLAALRYEEQFGLTPSARTRITGLETEREKNEYAGFRAG